MLLPLEDFLLSLPSSIALDLFKEKQTSRINEFHHSSLDFFSSNVVILSSEFRMVLEATTASSLTMLPFTFVDVSSELLVAVLCD
jgi:hypothetical protein